MRLPAAFIYDPAVHIRVTLRPRPGDGAVRPHSRGARRRPARRTRILPAAPAVPDRGRSKDADKPKPLPGRGGTSRPNDDPFPSTYRAPEFARVRHSPRPHHDRGRSVDCRWGRARAATAALLPSVPPIEAPADAVVVDGTGKVVTPGLIDVALAPRRLRGAGRRGALGRQRGDGPDDAGGLGRALGVAAGPAVSAQPRRWRHDAAGAARVRQPDWRPQRRPEGGARAHGAGDEVPGREVRA